MPEIQITERIYERQGTLVDFIARGALGAEVLDQLIVSGKGIDDESSLWDFKGALPTIPSPRVNNFLQTQHETKIQEIVKDCVSFYNSYGGYLVVGVEDRTRQIVGFTSNFDAGDLNKKIYGATGRSIETTFRQIQYQNSGLVITLGLLLIPKRPADQKPVQFKKNAQAGENGKLAYKLNDFYLRDRDECRKAVTAEDFEHLFGPRDIAFLHLSPNVLDHNLPPRDYDLGRLYGRDNELTQLWSWLADSFNPVRILCGLGGVGKTSIAYTFAERLINSAPVYVNKLIWLGAKEKTFAPLQGKHVISARIDFSNIDEMLVALLQEVGCPKSQIPAQPSRDELLSMCQSHLSAFRYVLVIDNVDTLEDDDQQQVFHTLMQLCAVSKAKAMISARRNLGASKLMYTEIEGLSYGDFEDFVLEKTELLKINRSCTRGSSAMEDFFGASGGSPLFALSVLRLVSLGDPLSEAISHWKGSDGEAVRKAAFQREIDRLDATESKVLLTLCYLGQASVPELSNIIKATRFQIQNALEKLQAFSMISIDTSLPSGTVFKVPPTLALVSSLVEKRVPDAKEVGEACAKYIEITGDQGPFVAETISRVMVQLGAGNEPEALALTLTALNTLPDNGDLQCLLGRVYSSMGDTRAEDAYKKAFDLGCLKRELFDGWVKFRQSKENWRGVGLIAQDAERKLGMARYGWARHHAEMMIGDELAHTGEYKDAEHVYDLAIDNIKQTMVKYRNTLDYNLLKNLKDSLVVRWLGAVRMLAERQGEAFRRYIGATLKAIVSHKVSNPDVFKYATSAMIDWVERISDREVVSETARDQLTNLKSRISEARLVVEKRVDLPVAVRDKFIGETYRVLQKIDDTLGL